MSLPETCPFCGASPYVMADGKPCRGGDSWVLFSCDTALHAGQDIRRTQSRKCEGLERARLVDRLAALEAENKALRDRVAEADTERNGAQMALRRAYDAASRAADMRAAGNALARHVAEDTRGRTSRQLVEAWKEASQ